MKEFDPIAYKQMVKEYQRSDNPTGWFDSIYTDAQGDYKAVFWSDLEPSPYLIKWLKENQSEIVIDVLLLKGGVLEEEFKSVCTNLYIYSTKEKPLKFSELVYQKVKRKFGVKPEDI